MADEKTPTPWFAGPLATDDDGFTYRTIGPFAVEGVADEHYEDTIANVSGLNHDASANAAFIVKAVNCHDELVAALRFCYATLSNVVHTEKRLQIEVDAIARARFALAKADASLEDVGER